MHRGLELVKLPRRVGKRLLCFHKLLLVRSVAGLGRRRKCRPLLAYLQVQLLGRLLIVLELRLLLVHATPQMVALLFHSHHGLLCLVMLLLHPRELLLECAVGLCQLLVCFLINKQSKTLK